MPDGRFFAAVRTGSRFSLDLSGQYTKLMPHVPVVCRDGESVALVEEEASDDLHLVSRRAIMPLYRR